MLQRVNFIMMAVVMVLVLAMGIQLIFTQRANTSALQGITAQLAKIKTVAGGDEGSNGTFVLVQGDVERPGWYPIVVGSGATYLSDVIQRAGLIEADSMIRVDRKSGEATIQFNTSSSDLATRYGKFVMVPGAEIQVTRRPPHQRSLDPADDFNFTAVGHWLQVDKDGKPVIDGATLDIIAPEDIRNLKGVMLGTLKFPGIDDQLEMSFSDQNGSVGTLQIELHRPGTIKGRWEFANRMLRVNLTALASFSTAMPNQHPFMNQPAVMSQLSELLEFVHAPREAANATASAPDAQSQH